MRRPKETLPVLALLLGGLALWGVKQATRFYIDENEPLRPAVLPERDPLQPDTWLPKETAHNAEFAGLAPGYSREAGENIDIITPLNMEDRILVRKKGAKRKAAAGFVPASSPWEPDYFPVPHLFTAPGREITPLNLRDPAALVMPPAP
ncbi:MAG: hypothetical protein HY077_17025 [Elusimicrobia bacterium]|nr:hypothetical protein [Elusimicrobiota bacterium]